METRKLPHTTARETPWALSKLPAFPPVAAKLLQLLRSDDTGISSVVSLIASDSAFSAEVLRLANSAAYGLRTRVDSVQHAVAVLGLRRVQSLTVSISVMKSFLRGVLKNKVLQLCWSHSLATATLAERLSAPMGLDREMAYTAGILHDIGRLALLVAYPAEYANLIELAEENRFDMLDCERSLFEVDHCEAGAWIAQQGNFPEAFARVAELHHREPEPGGRKLVAAIHYACTLSDRLGFSVAAPSPGDDRAAEREASPLHDWRHGMPPEIKNALPEDAGEIRGWLLDRMQDLLNLS